MSVFMLSDPHLSFGADKPMDVFGARWDNYIQRLEDGWKSVVGQDDTVILPGDISWGMGLCSAADDLAFIDRLPGGKIIGKGNHDYWWQTMRKLCEFIESAGIKTVRFLYNNAYLCEDFIVAGTRGWLVQDTYSPDDAKIVAREAGRLRLSLDEAARLHTASPDAETVVFLHYPPAYNGAVCRPIADVLAEYGIKRCFYGHIHTSEPSLFERACGDTRLYCISADLLGFRPMKLNRE